MAAVTNTKQSNRMEINTEKAFLQSRKILDLKFYMNC